MNGQIHLNLIICGRAGWPAAFLSPQLLGAVLAADLWIQNLLLKLSAMQLIVYRLVCQWDALTSSSAFSKTQQQRQDQHMHAL